jgi:hypothetical protein
MSDNDFESVDGGEDNSTDEQVSPIVQRAMESGWRPQEEWEGDPDQWVDAKEFVFRGELMDRIKTQTKHLTKQEATIEELRKALNKLGDINSKIAEKEYKKAVADLRRQRVRAVSEGDEDLVLDLEEKIDELNNAKNDMIAAHLDEEDNTPNVSDKEIEFKNFYEGWVSRNNWYNSNLAMAGAADRLGHEFMSTTPNATPEDIFKYIDKKIREEFPHKFRTKEHSPKTVDSDNTTPPGKSKKKFTKRDLSEEQLKVGKVFVSTGALPDLQSYIDQLAELGEIG